MQKVIVIFGAGTGLGLSVARRFGREGYAVALVARRMEPLDTLVSALESEGIAATAFHADLAQEEQIWRAVSRIVDRYGHIDAIYYSPATVNAFDPALEMTPALFRAQLEFLFLGLVASIQAALPSMRSRGGGAILAGFGGTASQGLPFMSGPAPAQAAVRNYLQSLHGELQSDGIHVAMANISAVIRDSAYHQSMDAAPAAVPGDFEMPIVDPADIADDLWHAAARREGLEFFYPAPTPAA